MKRVLFVILILFLFVLIFGIVYKISTQLPRTIKTNSTNQLSTPPQDPTEYTYPGWLEYFNSNLGLHFLYPPQFKNYQQGSLTYKIVSLQGTAKIICLSLTDCSYEPPAVFDIRAASASKSNSTIPRVFSNLQGFIQERENYQVILPGNESLPLDSTYVRSHTLPSGLVALLIMGNNLELSGQIYPKKGWVGAIINTGFPDYPAIVVQMQLTQDLTIDTFVYLLESFSFPWKENFPPDSQIGQEPIPPRFFDPEIRSGIAKVAKIINCRYGLDGRYPDSYFPDSVCSTSETLVNSITQKPYHYTTANDGQGFILKAKLSTGEIYTITEASFPPPTPTPSP